MTLSRSDLREMTVQEVRDLAREKLGPASEAAMLRKEELIDAILAGEWPRLSRTIPVRSPHEVRMKKVVYAARELLEAYDEVEEEPVDFDGYLRNTVTEQIFNFFPEAKRPEGLDLDTRLNVEGFKLLEHLISFLEGLPRDVRQEIADRLMRDG